MKNHEIEVKIQGYLSFWGMTLSLEQTSQLVQYLLRFSMDEDELEHEMICEIRRFTEQEAKKGNPK